MYYVCKNHGILIRIQVFSSISPDSMYSAISGVESCVEILLETFSITRLHIFYLKTDMWDIIFNNTSTFLCDLYID